MIRVNKYSNKGKSEEHKRVLFLPENLAEAMLITRMQVKRGLIRTSINYNRVSSNGESFILRKEVGEYLANRTAPIFRFKFNKDIEGNYDLYVTQEDIKRINGATTERLEAKIEYSPETLANEW